MTLLKAIAGANALRPNAIDDAMKASWIYELEAEVAELMDVELPEMDYPNDQELLMPKPHDNFYHLYVCAMIDFALEDTQLYVNDMTMANSAKDAAFRWWRRNNLKKSPQYIRAFPWQAPIKGEKDDTTRTPDEDTTETITDIQAEGN